MLNNFKTLVTGLYCAMKFENSNAESGTMQ